MSLGASAASGAGLVPLTVDALARRTPISRYIYGQFTEHLGRCIYGGIWAEVLEDRKFFFPITADYHPYQALQNTPFPVVGTSPWQIVGDPAQVTMVTAGAFVGKQGPRLGAGAGIRQLGLAVVAGKSYTGYLWARSDGTGPAAVEVTLAWGAAPAQSSTVRLDAPIVRLPFVSDLYCPNVRFCSPRCGSRKRPPAGPRWNASETGLFQTNPHRFQLPPSPPFSTSFELV